MSRLKNILNKKSGIKSNSKILTSRHTCSVRSKVDIDPRELCNVLIGKDPSKKEMSEFMKAFEGKKIRNKNGI